MKRLYAFLSVPSILLLTIIRYYFFRILRLKLTSVESNWVYFLKQAIPKGIVLKKCKGEFELENKEFNHKARIRQGNSSDILVYLQIFFQNEYKPLVKYVKREDKMNIIDAGSNVGFFALYAEFFFPNSNIYCIEPSQTNCAQILKHQEINKISAWKIEQAALYIDNGLLELSSRNDHLEWNYTISKTNSGNIRAMTISQLVENFNVHLIDIFKIDIEGTENLLFQNPEFCEVVKSKVKTMVVETHDNNGKAAISYFLTHSGFQIEEVGELIFAYNGSL